MPPAARSDLLSMLPVLLLLQALLCRLCLGVRRRRARLLLLLHKAWPPAQGLAGGPARSPTGCIAPPLLPAHKHHGGKLVSMLAVAGGRCVRRNQSSCTCWPAPQCSNAVSSIL